jgi:plastocyanin
MKAFGLAAVLALSVVASACSSGSTPSSSGTTQPPPASPTATQTAGSGGGTSGPTTAKVQAGAGGFVFSPSTFTIAQGGVVTVKNVGTLTHTFTIQGHGVNEVMSPGQSAKVTINLPPGTYPFICTIHVSQGMRGTITVTG